MANTPKHSERNAEIKQNLFRFVHIKDVEVNTDEREQSYRSIIVDSEQSELLSAVKDIEDSSERKSAIETFVADFSPISTYKEANAKNQSITDFSHWLKSNKSKLKLDKLRIEIDGLSNYSVEQKKELWDNLFYYTLTNKSVVIRDVILRLLKTDHFIAKFNEFSRDYGESRFTKNQKRKIDKVAKANVMIPSYLFPKESKDLTITNRDSKGDKNLVKIIEKGILKDEINTLKGFQKELKEIVNIYRIENSKLYDIAKKSYNESVKLAFEKTTNTVDQETGLVTYEGMEFPPFKYIPKDMFDLDFLKSNLSEKAMSMFNKYYKSKLKKYDEIEKDIKSMIKDKTRKLFNIKTVKSKIVSHNGSKLEINLMPATPKIITKEIENFYETSKNSLYLTLYHPNNEEVISNMVLSVDSETELVGEIIHEEKNIFTYKFINESGSFSNDEETTIMGNFKNSNGNDFAFGKSGPVNEAKEYYCIIGTRDRCYIDRRTGYWICYDENGLAYSPIPEIVGQCAPVVYDGEPGDVSPIYGMKKIGIAEFKRVEQELCCYVEGEVSHIENILAREYKEKATRSLTRSEITTEETEERESENLTDTTSTDRYEMQQEVATVLEKSNELSYGASVSASGGQKNEMYYWDASVNAYIDGTNSSSSSNSFNQSESFAKEVVERAMNRVVKKSSYKRTSRMLREFEENNKHGFDNRKGSKHVTGIYRWVDKIYKNKLVNYGKRLIYEFAIPEPAKGWKDLILKENNESPVKPKEPLLDDIKDWEDIDSTNYSKLAGKFNADVEPYPGDEVIISKSFAKTFTGEPKSEVEAAMSFELKIPEGFYCENVKYNWGYTHHGSNYSGLRGTGNFGFLPEVAIGSYVDVGISYSLGSNSSTHNALCIKRVEKFLPISFNGKDVGSFRMNVSAICNLTEVALENWQRQTYLAIMEAYERKYQEYLELLAQWEIQNNAINGTNDGLDYNNNPLLNRRIEQTELKKTAIQYMLSQFDQRIGQRFRYKTSKNCQSGVIMNSDLADYSEIIKFLEGAIDWNLMAYTFHPYFWANCSDTTWQEMLNTTSKSDPLFEAFLQAGFADLKVPIKGGSEAAVLFFLDTGKIWKKGDVVIDGKDGVYQSSLLSLDIKSADSNCCDCEDGDELVADNCCSDEEEVCIEAKWTSRVPTTLTIVQDYAAPLSANGLPCFSKNDPKVKFCEDGTPLGSLDPDDIDQNGGVMVGLDNDDLAYSCSIMLNNQATLLEAANTIVTDLNDGDDATEAIDQLKEILDTLNDLFADGEANGCNTIPVQQSIDAVKVHIASLTA